MFKLWSDSEKRLGPARPAAVGYINGIRPTVHVAASCAPAHFNYIWLLAPSGHFTHVYMFFTKPHYGSASVLNLSFSNRCCDRHVHWRRALACSARRGIELVDTVRLAERAAN